MLKRIIALGMALILLTVPALGESGQVAELEARIAELEAENAELRERCARFEERAVARSAPQPGIVDQEERQGSVPDVFEERPPIPSNDVIRCPRMDK